MAVAVKSLKGIDPENLQDFQQEIKLMTQLRHPNIVEFLGTCEHGENMLMVTEFCPNGSLEDWIKKRWEAGRKLSVRSVLNIATDLARGLNWLHHRGIIHRDLKPANILVDKNHNMKIADFGLAHVKKRMNTTALGFYGDVGTPCYMAPEVLANKRYGMSCDVFSFGMMLAELVTGYYPFKINGKASVNTNDFGDAILAGERPQIPKDCNPGVARLIKACWDVDPEKRPSCDDIMQTLEQIRQDRRAMVRDLLDEQPAEVVELFDDQKRQIANLNAKVKTLTRELSKAKREATKTAREKETIEKQARDEQKAKDKTIRRLTQQVQTLQRQAQAHAQSEADELQSAAADSDDTTSVEDEEREASTRSGKGRRALSVEAQAEAEASEAEHSEHEEHDGEESGVESAENEDGEASCDDGESGSEAEGNSDGSGSDSEGSGSGSGSGSDGEGSDSESEEEDGDSQASEDEQEQEQTARERKSDSAMDTSERKFDDKENLAAKPRRERRLPAKLQPSTAAVKVGGVQPRRRRALQRIEENKHDKPSKSEEAKPALALPVSRKRNLRSVAEAVEQAAPKRLRGLRGARVLRQRGSILRLR